MKLPPWSMAAVLLMAGVAAGQATPATTPRSIQIPDIPPAVQDKFTAADTDRSGGLDRGELAKAGFAVERNFGAIDTDGNRIITLAEIGSYLAARGREWASADKDKDGQISREEAAAHPGLASIFTQADRDSDGIIRREEHEAFSQTTLYQNVDLPWVVPNIIDKRF